MIRKYELLASAAKIQRFTYEFSKNGKIIKIKSISKPDEIRYIFSDSGIFDFTWKFDDVGSYVQVGRFS